MWSVEVLSCWYVLDLMVSWCWSWLFVRDDYMEPLKLLMLHFQTTICLSVHINIIYFLLRITFTEILGQLHKIARCWKVIFLFFASMVLKNLEVSSFWPKTSSLFWDHITWPCFTLTVKKVWKVVAWLHLCLRQCNFAWDFTCTLKYTAFEDLDPQWDCVQFRSSNIYARKAHPLPQNHALNRWEPM